MRILDKIQSQINVKEEKASYLEQKIIGELLLQGVLEISSWVDQDGEGFVKVKTKSAEKTYQM